MYELNDLLKRFVTACREILGDDLVGVYLHGSAAMGCYNEKKSDIDLIVVVNEAVSDDVKRRFMDMVVELNGHAPKKGIEMSIVKKEACDPFIYPTPYELHFSNAHLERYKADPRDYIEKMQGTDKDLAAHFTIILNRGKCLFGKAVKEVFGAVRKEYYFDSIFADIENAEAGIKNDPVYFILNLCRVLAYKKEELVLSKAEGGKWGMQNLPEKFRPLISQAMNEYSSDTTANYDENISREFAAYMINMIKN